MTSARLLRFVAAGPPDQNQADSFFGEIGLLIFIALFAAVLIYTFRRRNQKTFEHAKELPLDDAPLGDHLDEHGNLANNPASEERS